MKKVELELPETEEELKYFLIKRKFHKSSCENYFFKNKNGLFIWVEDSMLKFSSVYDTNKYSVCRLHYDELALIILGLDG